MPPPREKPQKPQPRGSPAPAGSLAPSPAQRSSADSPPKQVSDDGADRLPLVPLPSRFKPVMFRQASQARGVRPAALKVIDDMLESVDHADDPRERFDRLAALQRIVSDYVARYGKDNSRGSVTAELKRWVDGAVALREPWFRDNKVTEDEPALAARPGPGPSGTR